MSRLSKWEKFCKMVIAGHVTNLRDNGKAIRISDIYISKGKEEEISIVMATLMRSAPHRKY